MDKLVAALLAAFASLFGGKKAPTAAPDASAAPTASDPVQPSLTPQTTPSEAPSAPDGLTARGCMELIGHEAVVLEWYLDSEKVGTWGIGVTNASGHNVDRYKDNPQSISHVLEIFIWLLRSKYLPQVIRAFRGAPLSEAQLAAALSFHYNTGAIGHASWVSFFLSGHLDTARTEFMVWDKPASIIERRQAERDLFFSGIWSSDGKALVLPVLKPSYQPDFRHGQRIDVLPALQALLGG